MKLVKNVEAISDSFLVMEIVCTQHEGLWGSGSISSLIMRVGGPHSQSRCLQLGLCLTGLSYHNINMCHLGA
jgi:hypothetical protein